ncbi:MULTISPECIES: hypothetical protein [Xanthomonas]|uniref:Uncharacterized protein n=1 Tax=Xanthomonas dyei TaxID=743699 RepID=A0ABZ0DBK2_9XANT|nr:hypothetical protein [Xanthomonas dyei]WOB27565.1 hypothetical protein NYR99_06400 [Xanthomonas dyei]WOB55187.1 hypothetical protein NYR95_06405 [Xanthomonas dyei]
MHHRHLNGLLVGVVLIVAAGCAQDSARSATSPSATIAAAKNVYPEVPLSSPKPWKQFALEQDMGATCTTRLQRSASGRSVLLPADECIGPAPRPLAQVILALSSSDLAITPDTRADALKHAVYVASAGLGKRADFMLATDAFWVRSFESPDPLDVVYLVGGVRCTDQAVDCKDSGGVRAFRFDAKGQLADVSKEVLPPAPTLTEDEIRRYQPYAEPVPFLDMSRLWAVPVLRWVIEFDPDAPLASDPRYYNDWAYLHFGFLVWNGQRFDLMNTVDRSRWPCRPVAEGKAACSGPLDNKGDRFVTH